MTSPFSQKQIDFYNNSNARLNIAVGAVRSGKSYITILRFLNELRTGPPGRYLITGKSERTIISNILAPMQDLVGGIIRFNKSSGTFELFGKTVYVVSAVDERSEARIRGATYSGCLVDEITILPPSFFRMLLSRLSVEGSKLIGSTNPDSPMHWLKTDILDRFEGDNDQLYHLHFDLEDNPSLTEGFKASLRKEYQGLWFKRFILGDWVLAEGSVYDFFDTSLHVVQGPPTYAKQYYLGIDYGTSNAFAALLIGYNDDHKPSLWVEKEYYWDSRKRGFQKTDAEYAIDLINTFEGYPINQIFLDPSAASFHVELKRHKMPVRQANNDVLDGIRFCSTLLSGSNLVICNPCINLIKSIESYVWDENAAKRGEDKPKKVNDHMCFIAGTKVATAMGLVSIECIKIGDMILTPNGFFPCVATMSSKTDELYELNTPHGFLIGTGDHPILIENEPFPLNSLHGCYKISYICQNKSNLTELSTGVIPNQSQYPIKDISAPIFTESRKEKATFIETCGSFIMGLFRRVATSIISMVTPETMNYKTSLACPTRNTPSNTQFGEAGKKNYSATFTRYAPLPLSGTEAKQVENGIDNKVSTDGKIGKHCLTIASNAEKNTTQETGEPTNSVVTIVSLNTGASQEWTIKSELVSCAARGLSVTDMREKRLAPVSVVYNIEVESEHSYFANNILVANCDAMRYVLYSKFGKKQTLKEETQSERANKAYQANPAAFPGFSANDFGWQALR